jgi:hypothetical protein
LVTSGARCPVPASLPSSDPGRVPSGVMREAYSWGGMARNSVGSSSRVGKTISGGARLGWTLLLPFSLLNMAYWSRRLVKPGRQPHEAWHNAGGAALIRLSALALTLLMATTVSVLSLDVVGVQYYTGTTCSKFPSAVGFFGHWQPTQRLALMSLVPVAVAVATLLYVLTSVSSVRYTQTSTAARVEIGRRRWRRCLVRYAAMAVVEYEGILEPGPHPCANFTVASRRRSGSSQPDHCLADRVRNRIELRELDRAAQGGVPCAGRGYRRPMDCWHGRHRSVRRPSRADRDAGHAGERGLGRHLVFQEASEPPRHDDRGSSSRWGFGDACGDRRGAGWRQPLFRCLVTSAGTAVGQVALENGDHDLRGESDGGEVEQQGKA